MKTDKNYKNEYQIFESFENEFLKPLVYLDSASSSLTPRVVVDAMSNYYNTYRSNIDRGEFIFAQRALDKYEDSRKLVAEYVGATEEEIFFTSGATDSANKLFDMWVCLLDIKDGDSVAVSSLEHHAVYVTIYEKCKKLGIRVLEIPLKDDHSIDTALYQDILSKKPKLVFIQHANNVTGKVLDIKNLADQAHGAGSYFISDGSQAVGHIDVDVKTRGVDSYFWSAHKMCGPTGVGVVYIPKHIISKMKPTVYGGGIVTKVDSKKIEYIENIKCFEPGSPNIAGVIGLGEAVEYLQNIGIQNIENHSKEITSILIKKLENIEGVSIITEREVTKNTGIVSFSVEGVHTHDLTYLLAKSGIAVRSGFHCAEPFVRSISETAVTRISIYIYNTKEDIDILIKELKKIIQKFI